jgi:hypothetical protein
MPFTICVPIVCQLQDNGYDLSLKRHKLWPSISPDVWTLPFKMLIFGFHLSPEFLTYEPIRTCQGKACRCNRRCSEFVEIVFRLCAALLDLGSTVLVARIPDMRTSSYFWARRHSTRLAHFALVIRPYDSFGPLLCPSRLMATIALQHRPASDAPARLSSPASSYLWGKPLLCPSRLMATFAPRQGVTHAS